VLGSVGPDGSLDGEGMRASYWLPEGAGHTSFLSGVRRPCRGIVRGSASTKACFENHFEIDMG